MTDWIDRDGRLIDAKAEAHSEVMDLAAGLDETGRRAVLRRQLKRLNGEVKEKDEALRDLKAERDELSANIPASYWGKPLFPGIPNPAADPPRNLRELSAAATILWGAKERTGAVPKELLGCALIDWYKLGFPTFELTGSLGAALMLTECRGLLGRDLRAPFAVFAAQLPSPSPLLVGGADAKWLVVHRWASGFHIEVCTTGPYTVIDLRAPDEAEALDPWARGCGNPSVARFVVNLCVYINSLHALPRPEGQRKPGGGSRKREKEPQTPQRWVLGREIKLSNGMLQAARAVASGATTAKQRAEYRMHARFMVRGHWRNQACGAKRAERRMRWIEPYWKGPEMAEGLARLYSLPDEGHAPEAP